jgi:hypothetical protein
MDGPPFPTLNTSSPFVPLTPYIPKSGWATKLSVTELHPKVGGGVLALIEGNPTVWQAFANVGSAFGPLARGSFPLYSFCMLSTSSGVILAGGINPGLAVHASWDGGMTWNTANSICKDAGQRLCTDAEGLSETGGYTGCGFDNKNVWTSTPWDEVPEAARAPDNYKKNGCPDGYTQSGGLGADKGGCGLEKCGDRYGGHAKNENECAKYCNDKSNCKSFSYAPNNGDKNHQGKLVCTIYSSTDFNQKWYGKENGWLTYKQIACVKN